MSGQVSLSSLSARVSGLRQAMESVISGSTPDHAKWIAVNSFARTYCDLAGHYVSLTGDTGINRYNLDNLKSPFDTVWPSQKALFDTIYADVIILSNLLNNIGDVSPLVFYNLFVSGDAQEWTGRPFRTELARCLREYTAPHLTRRFGKLDAASIIELKKAPCIFAYEVGVNVDPKFGYITDIVQRQDLVRIEYNIHEIEGFLSYTDIDDMMFELDISKLEMYRSHWAVKDVNLSKELHAKGIEIPRYLREVSNAVDISQHSFDIALSFPGEVRPLVEGITKELERTLGPNSYFYDMNYRSQLARPSLDSLLQGIYSRAKLIVAFIGADYQKKDWCGVEFRVVKEILLARQNSRIMYVRTDDGHVDGILKTDGYLSAIGMSAEEIAISICERVRILNS